MQTPATKTVETQPETLNSTESGVQKKEYEGVRIESIIYPLAIFGAILTWFFSVRYPLWLDETISYWQVAGGFSQLWERQGAMFVAYPFILWLAKSVLGTSVLALRAPSIVAMLTATYIFYKVAKQLIGRAGASTATVIFCVHPAVASAAIDARPYAFATLAVMTTMYMAVRWVRSSSTRDAVLFGASAAFILYFHFLFGMILPAFAIYLWAASRWGQPSFRPNWGAALGTFAAMCIPITGLLLKMFVSRGSHVFSSAPSISELALAFASDNIFALFALTALLAAATKRYAARVEEPRDAAWIALLFCFVPLLGFYLVSVLTPIHMFVPRYYLAAVPGIALCWGMMVSRFDSKWLRASFCATVMATAVMISYEPTFSAPHGYTWKFALQAAEQNAAHDHAPILICSDLPESNSVEGPIDPSSVYLAQLSYYKVNSPVIGLPRSLTPAAKREISDFLRQAIPRRQRFLAVSYIQSYDTIRYLMGAVGDNYVVHRVDVSDRVGVVEFRPK